MSLKLHNLFFSTVKDQSEEDLKLDKLVNKKFKLEQINDVAEGSPIQWIVCDSKEIINTEGEECRSN